MWVFSPNLISGNGVHRAVASRVRDVGVGPAEERKSVFVFPLNRACATVGQRSRSCRWSGSLRTVG